MDIRNLIFQLLTISLLLLALQRTERKRRWWVALLLTVPGIFLLWRVSIFNLHLTEYYVALGVGVVLNVLFWLAYGRRFPPGYQGAIEVIGQED